jgi:hypothetical protein
MGASGGSYQFSVVSGQLRGLSALSSQPEEKRWDLGYVKIIVASKLL